MTHVPETLTSALADRYTIERELGSGGMATVYLAEDLKHHRKVAIKVLRPELTASIGVERFLREIEITANLNHPHILPLLDSGILEDQPSGQATAVPPYRPTALLYYVMPYFEGESLRDRLNREKQLPIDDALKLAGEVADALGSAHRHNVVHRDLKPENILLQEGHAVVADFGVARAIEEAEETRLTETGMAIGTPAYLSPEQATGEREIAGTSDIYSLGCVLYEMLAGEPPFTGPTVRSIVHQHLATEPRSLIEVLPGVPLELDVAVSKALAKEPEDRHQSAEEFAATLRELGVTISGSTASAVVRRWGNPLTLAGVFGAGALVVLGVVYVLVIQLGLPDWVLVAAGVLLVVLLPFAVGTGLIERQRITRKMSTPSSGVRRVLHQWLRWRKAARGSVMVFVGLGVVTTGYMGLRSMGIGPMGTLLAKGVLTEQDRILVAEFENRTSDSLLGATLTDALQIDLSQSPTIQVVELQELANALTRMGRGAGEPVTLEVAQELAEREGVKAIVAGEVGALGNGYVLTSRLIAAATGEVLVSDRATASDADNLIQAVDGLSAKLRERIGESLRSVRGTPPLKRVTTSSLEALRVFTQAERVARESGREAAIPFYERAIELDTAFAMAYRKLAFLLGNMGRNPARRLELIRKAYEHRDRLTERERLLVEAAYQMQVERDPVKGEATYRRIIERYPDEQIALKNLGVRLNRTGEYAEAEELLRRRRDIAERTGHYGGAYVDILISQFMLDEHAALDTSVQMLEAVRPSLALGWRAYIAAARRDYDEAWNGYEQVAENNPESGWNSLQWIASLRGQTRLASEMSGRWAAICRERSDYYCLMHEAYELARLNAICRDSTGRAIRLLDTAVESHMDSIPEDQRDQILRDVATWYAELGQDSTAAAYLTKYQSEFPEEVRMLMRGPSTRVAAWVDLAEGDYEEAIVAFRYLSTWESQASSYAMGLSFDRMGSLDSALVYYDRAIAERTIHRLENEWDRLPFVYRRLGELYEQRGETETAVHWYNEFVELWKDADPELLPQVEDVRGRIARLVGEPRP
ncbi:protein kinase [Gemmatimonadota bacterium]